MEEPTPLVYHGKRFWNADAFDALAPKTPGFVNDFVLALRGNEVPVAFSIWAALTTLSAALKRETWLKWSADPLFPNIFLVLVAPAGMAKKSVPISLACWSLEHMNEYFVSVNTGIRKNINFFRDKITGEAIAKFLAKKMKPRDVPLLNEKGHRLKDASGQYVSYRKCAECILVAPELGTMLSRARYNEDLITTLTKLYDTESPFENTTAGGGVKRLTELHVCLLGGTTPSAIRDSIPKSAVEEGFLSRLVLINQERAATLYHRPRDVGVPRAEIASRLAWLVENTAGQWDLTVEADRHYEHWYKDMREHYNHGRFHPVQASRFSIHVLKVALLYSAQRYVNHLERGSRVIDLECVKQAIALVEATMESAVPLIEETEATPAGRLQLRVLKYLESHGGATRKQLLQGAHMTAGEATAAISDLFQAGRIRLKEGAAPEYSAGERYYSAREGRPRVRNKDEKNEDEA